MEREYLYLGVGGERESIWTTSLGEQVKVIQWSVRVYIYGQDNQLSSVLLSCSITLSL